MRVSPTTKRALLSALLCFPVTVAAAADGPFGVEMGSDPGDYGCTETKTPTMYRCSDVPKPHPSMESYIIQSAPGIGVCWVKGVGQSFPTSRMGAAIVSATDEIAGQVGAKYGRFSKETDFFAPRSIWDEPEDFVMGLLKQERFYSYTWSGGLPNNVNTAFVAARAVGSDEGSVIGEFSFQNEPQCEAAKKKIGASAF